ncbi:kinase-like domain-containing protein [Jimgerdemannia flammicorona]|uniref:Kinase-like domain-containing protein n=1 Tax=Jimgerdemannia flammicorona TaxID=994334 RepID=A0A433QRI2_9FUNG|nr:kinase-like domain-containing protein [Jimgerdemannia flammicorona]
MSNSELNTAWIVGKIIQNKRFALRPIRHPSLPRIPRLFPDSVELGDKIGQGGFDVAKGLDSAHAEGIIHGDLKATNILLDQFLTPKLADFGISKTFSSLGRGSQLGLTLRYVAPERLEYPGKNFTHSESVLSDNYEFGLVMWEVVTDGKQPYGDMNDLSISIAKRKDGDQLQYVGSLHGNLPRVFQRLVSSFLALDPTLRPSLAVAQDFLNVYMDNAPPPLAFPTLSLNTIATTIPVITRPETPESPNDPFPEIDPFQSSIVITDYEIDRLSTPRRKYLKAAYYFSKERFSDAIRQFEQSESLHQPLSQRALGLCNRALGEDADASSGRRKVAILKDNSISPGASTMGMGLKVMTSSLSVGTRRRPVGRARERRLDCATSNGSATCTKPSPRRQTARLWPGFSEFSNGGLARLSY